MEMKPPFSIRGTFLGGQAQPVEPVEEGLEGKEVLITFLESDVPGPEIADEVAAQDPLLRLIKDCQMDTGITYLAHQHNHYLHGASKKP